MWFILYMTAVGVFVCLGMSPFWVDRPIVWLMRQFNVFLYPDAIRLAVSLERDTSSWRFTQHQAENQQIGAIWISNGAFGVHVDIKLGNDTIEWRPGWIEQQIIYSAEKQARACVIHEHLDKVLPR
jgi:hypothetical protein